MTEHRSKSNRKTRDSKRFERLPRFGACGKILSGEDGGVKTAAVCSGRSRAAACAGARARALRRPRERETGCATHASSRLTATAAGDCSEATAQALARKYRLGDSTYNYPVGQVLCGAFTGPSSNAIAFSFHYYGCIPVSGFAVFRFTGGEWQLVLENADVAVSLFQAGSDIREKVSVFRKGDSRCVPSGGTRSRVWHWDGQRLFASTWKQQTAPKGSGKLTVAGFYSPSGNLSCEMDDGRAGVPNHVWCQSWKKPHRVTLRPDGRLNTCRGERCLGNPGENTPRLAYGKHITVGRFRCFSLQAGIKCVVISSGRGFLIDKVGVHRVGP